MKKNTKIGIGVAVASVISLAVAFPVLADKAPKDIETAGTVVTEEVTDETTPSIEELKYEETQAEETQAEETEAEEAEIEVDEDLFAELPTEDSVNSPDFENSPNFVRMSISEDGEGFENVVPSDYEDPELRRLAEEYVAQGYFIDDLKYDATHYGSGTGGFQYLFCNGFSVVDTEDGNNTFFYSILKATPEEFEWFMNSIGYYDVTYDGDKVLIEKDYGYQFESYSYDRETEVFTHKVNFFAQGVG